MVDGLGASSSGSRAPRPRSLAPSCSRQRRGDSPRLTLDGDASVLQTYAAVMDEFGPDFEIVASCKQRDLGTYATPPRRSSPR